MSSMSAQANRGNVNSDKRRHSSIALADAVAEALSPQFNVGDTDHSSPSVRVFFEGTWFTLEIKPDV